MTVTPLDVARRPPHPPSWQSSSNQPRANSRRAPLCDGGPAMPGHRQALAAVAAGQVRRTLAHGTDDRYRWSWIGWGCVATVRIPSPARRYLVELAVAGMVDGDDPVVLTDTGRALLEELNGRWLT